MIVWTIIKRAGLDFWEEMLLLLIFNIFWVVGSILILPYPFLTFAMFYTVRDVGEGKGIKTSTFFGYGKQHWKAAYIWGVINIGVLFMLWLNIGFYADINAIWAYYIRLFFISMTAFWLVMQLIVLALYPRLVEPSFKLASRNAMIIIGRQAPILSAILLIIIALLFITIVFMPLMGFLVTFSFIAVLTNSLVDTLVKRELDREEEAESENRPPPTPKNW